MSKYMPEHNIFQTKSNLMMISPESPETRLLLEVKLRNNAYVTHIFKCLPKFSLTFFSSMDFFLIFFFFAEFFFSAAILICTVRETQWKAKEVYSRLQSGSLLFSVSGCWVHFFFTPSQFSAWTVVWASTMWRVLFTNPQLPDQSLQFPHVQDTDWQVHTEVRVSVSGPAGQDWGKPLQLFCWTVT